MNAKETIVRAALGACAVAGIAYGAGSRASSTHEHARAASSPSPSGGSGAAAATPSVPARGNDPFGGMDLNAIGSKLAAEKAASGASNPSAATVFEAIRGQLELPIAQRLQVYAGGVGATFCDRIATTSDVYVVVCEFADEAAARKGVAAGSIKTIPRREVLRVRNATVAIHRTSESAACDADALKIKNLVVKL